MSKSRRGLLAAGLAVAVVGALGVAASNLTAGADEITEAAATPAATEIVSDAKPPATLPWGEKPKQMKRGRGGETSRALKSEGLSFAPADASGSTEPEKRYGPKGRSGRNSFLKSEVTTIAPPVPPEDNATPTPSVRPSGDTEDVYYLYNVGSQWAEADGVYAGITIGKPKLSKKDYHTLGELAVQSRDGQQIVEVGWTVDRLVNGDDDPHLFVYHWVNGKPTCYNACGFVPYEKGVKPGDTLTYDVTKKFGIQYFDEAWWVAYDSEWVGHFPEALWKKHGVSFDRSGLVQVFGEIAATRTKPCGTAMGNGLLPTEDDAARVASLSYLNGPPAGMTIRTTTEHFRVNKLSGRTFRYGGPGPTGC